MTDRDHFAAAALSGLIASEGAEAYLMQAWCYRAFAWADAMLRERDVVRDSRTADMANHDAAPAARARTNAAGISRQGTGETPVSYEKTDEKRGNSPAIRATTRPRNGTPAEGSVQGEGTDPVAWGLPNAGGDEIWATSLNKEAIERHCPTSQTLVPLYRRPQPTLTDAEREAVEACAHAAENCNGFGGDPTRPAIYEGRQVAATLRGLLERLK